MHTVVTRARTLLLALTVALSVPVVLAQPAHAAVTQGITGVISGQGVGPMNGSLAVERVQGGIPIAPWVITLSDDDGTFAVGLQPGEYYVRFYAPPPFAPEWWDDSPTRAGSTKVVVTPGALTTLNPVLQPGGTITGHVATDPGNVWVEARITDPDYPTGYLDMNSVPTDANGNYSLPGLPAGSYQVFFDDRAAHTEGWWQNTGQAAAATPVQVAEGATVPGIDGSGFAADGTLSGTVTSAVTGAAPGQVQVTIEHYLPSDGWVPSGGTMTATDGTWSVARPSGIYRLYFEPYDAALRSEYWNNAVTAAASALVTVTGTALDDLDVSLEPYAVVSKTDPGITGLPRVGRTLTAYDGTWYPSTVARTRVWLRDGAVIPGATGTTYVAQAADLGKKITVRVTAAEAGYTSTAAESWWTTPVDEGKFAISTRPQVHGTLKSGRTVRAVVPTLRPAAARVTYQWLRGGTAIHGARHATYRLRSADQHHRIGVLITSYRPGYAPIVTRVVRPTRVR